MDGAQTMWVQHAEPGSTAELKSFLHSAKVGTDVKEAERRADMKDQSAWMDRQAKAMGYADADALATDGSPESTDRLNQLAQQWRAFHGKDKGGNLVQNTAVRAIVGKLYGHTGTPLDDAAGATGTHLQSARDDLRRNGAADPREQGESRNALELQAAAKQNKAVLVNWARDHGLLISKLPFRLEGPADVGESEHHAFVVGNRVVKITRGSGESFGNWPVMHRGAWELRKGTAGQYLERIAAANQFTGDDTRLHGIFADRQGNVSIVTSQPFIKGPDSTPEFTKAAMESQGFRQLGSTASAYLRLEPEGRATAVLDNHPGNAKRVGDALAIFDAVILHPKGQMLEAMQAEMENPSALHSASVAPEPEGHKLADVPGWDDFQSSIKGHRTNEALSTEEMGAKIASESEAYHSANPQSQAIMEERKAAGELIGRPIPPAWRNAEYFPNGRKIIARGRDAAGRIQTFRSSAEEQRALAEKFQRGTEVNAALPDILTALHKGIQEGKPEASVLRLIYLSGFRNGGEGDGKAKEQAYGATSLRGDHVTIEGDTVHFDFTGKLGVRQQHTIVNHELAQDLAARKAATGDGPLFATTSDKVLAYLKKVSGNKDFLVHDLRTWNATALADRLTESEEAPTDATDYWLKRDAVADVVARKLGDTRKVVLESYINPIVFAKWQESAKVTDGEQRPKISRKVAEARGSTGKLGRDAGAYEQALHGELLPSARAFSPARPEGRGRELELGFAPSSASENKRLQTARFKPVDPRTPTLSFDNGDTLTAPTLFAATVAYHDTPHEVDEFRTDKIGTSEGAQAYGWGLYFAKNKDTAETYRRDLGGVVKVDGKTIMRDNQKIGSTGDTTLDDLLMAFGGNIDPAIAWAKDGLDEWIPKLEALRGRVEQSNKGNLYTVDLLPDESDFLAWDKPLSEQSAIVEKMRLSSEQSVQRFISDNMQFFPRSSGKDLISKMNVSFDGGAKAASEHLASLGIPGIKFLDQGSRTIGPFRGDSAHTAAAESFKAAGTPHKQALEGMVKAYRSSPRSELQQAINHVYGVAEGTHNYVLFDDKDIRITHRNGQEVAAPSLFSATTGGHDLLGADAPFNLTREAARNKPAPRAATAPRADTNDLFSLSHGEKALADFRNAPDTRTSASNADLRAAIEHAETLPQPPPLLKQLKEERWARALKTPPLDAATALSRLPSYGDGQPFPSIRADEALYGAKGMRDHATAETVRDRLNKLQQSATDTPASAAPAQWAPLLHGYQATLERLRSLEAAQPNLFSAKVAADNSEDLTGNPGFYSQLARVVQTNPLISHDPSSRPHRVCRRSGSSRCRSVMASASPYMMKSSASAAAMRSGITRSALPCAGTMRSCAANWRRWVSLIGCEAFAVISRRHLR